MTIRVPWTSNELTQLGAIDPKDRNAVSQFAMRFGRSPASVSTKLALLRVRRIAAEKAQPQLDDDMAPAPSDQVADDLAFQAALRGAIEKGLERFPS
jgi:hypothetical protein